MTWTTPMTAVSGAQLLASTYNTQVRDNFNELEAAKAVNRGSYIVSTGAHALAERIGVTDFISTTQDTTSGTYTNLASTGPRVTVTCGERAMVIAQCLMNNSGANSCYMSYEISGATSRAASDNWCVRNQGTEVMGMGIMGIRVALTPGSHTFTAKYRVAGGTGHFTFRNIIVLPF